MAVTGDQTGTTREKGAAQPHPLTHNALNLPNIITVSRLVLSFVLFVMIWLEISWIGAAVLFVVAAATDALDGYIARRYGQITTLGRILDPFVDKIIVCGSFVFLLEKSGSGVNAWMVIAVIGREMFVTGLRSFLETLGKDFSASLSGKLKMGLQCVAVTISLLSLHAAFAEHRWFILMRDAILWGTVAITLYSGYVYIQRAAVLLRPDTNR